MTAAVLAALIFAAPAAAVPRWPWLALARCETGVTWTWWNSQYEGAYGFTHDAWHQWRYRWMPWSAARATPAQQTLVAIRIQRAVGWGAWPACSVRLGLR